MNNLQNFIKESKNENSAITALTSLKDFDCDWYMFPDVNGVLELNDALIDTFGPAEASDPYCSAVEIDPEDFEELSTPFHVLITRQKPLVGLTPFVKTVDVSEDNSFNRNKIFIYLVK